MRLVRSLANQDWGNVTVRLIVGISGASGVIYGIRLLEMLRDAGVESHLVMSRAAEITVAHETRHKLADVRALASTVHNVGDIAASISSGSFRTSGMIIAPCSMRSLAEIVSGVTSTLLTRAADVVLKERRRLVLLVRESRCILDTCGAWLLRRRWGPS